MNISDFYEAEQPKKKKILLLSKNGHNTVKENLIKARRLLWPNLIEEN